jgi:hypothetical protein
MTISQLESLSEEELELALYIVNVVAPQGFPIEMSPRGLTWFRKGTLEKKFLEIFPKLKPEGHAIYSSLLTKLGVQHEIKYEVKPPSQIPDSVPESGSLSGSL